ncbi:HAD family hydrolase [Paraburkholderia antibiotica]|uniref:HAD family phosphatase n=1 Tax=Paraburkholderia antibiotica TaxID=2728839 RepID=A0A7X9X5C9_9BURK|nr:HAD family phosphatase [Paraburkholderia antibiotica]NML31754.1 HAD family phosphatase [Paraburkholderia antibiotica]
MQNLEAVVFDLDDVLCNYDRHAMATNLARHSGCQAQEVYDAIWNSGLDSRSDRGDITADAFLAELGKSIGFRVTVDAWVEARTAGTRIDEAVLEIASTLNRSYELAVLTNNSSLVATHMESICPPVARRFAGRIYASAALGGAKPARRAYLGCTEALGIDPANVLFIDDLQKNVEGARQAGLRALLFRGAAQLRDDLAGLGVLDEAPSRVQ